MPPMFPHSVDRLAALQLLAASRVGTSLSRLFEEMMQVGCVRCTTLPVNLTLTLILIPSLTKTLTLPLKLTLTLH